MTRPPLRSPGSARSSFTLVEVLVAVGILAVILLVVLGIINATGKAWNGAVARTESFQDARAAFEALTRQMGGATLNAYYQVTNTVGGTNGFARVSDLQFVSGSAAVTGLSGSPQQIGHAVFFQAPLGYTTNSVYASLGGTLNACGFYLDYSRDPIRPAFLDNVLGAASNPYRFRLHQVLQSTDQSSIYDHANDNGWIGDAVTGCSHPLAVNVVALVFVAENPTASSLSAATNAPSSISSSYDYDSRSTASSAYTNQLPPVIEVFMAAIDEASAKRICTSATPPELGQSTLFRDTAKMDDDIAALDAILSGTPGNAAGNRVPLTHRFFRSKVVIQGAKWSD